MSLPINKRYEAIFLHLHPKGPKMGLTDTANEIGCARSSVVFWVKRWYKTKDLSDKPKTGRVRKTTSRQDNVIVKLAKEENDITSYKIQQEVKKRKIEVSVRTINRRLKEAGGKYSNKLIKPLLTEKHQQKRLEWAKKHQKFNWNTVVFSDESTFRLNQPTKKVWQFPGKKKIFRSVKYPLKINVWGCFSASGFGKLICFQQNLNAEFMLTIYKKGLLPSVSKLFGNNNPRWILQEDNDPKHRSKLASEWKKNKKIKTLTWPAMSPDQNPIENVWRLLKINISKKKISTLELFKKELIKEWNNLPDSLAEKLVESMERRIAALIDADGDFTLY